MGVDEDDQKIANPSDHVLGFMREMRLNLVLTGSQLEFVAVGLVGLESRLLGVLLEEVPLAVLSVEDDRCRASPRTSSRLTLSWE